MTGDRLIPCGLCPPPAASSGRPPLRLIPSRRLLSRLRLDSLKNSADRLARVDRASRYAVARASALQNTLQRQAPEFEINIAERIFNNQPAQDVHMISARATPCSKSTCPWAPGKRSIRSTSGSRRHWWGVVRAHLHLRSRRIPAGAVLHCLSSEPMIIVAKVT